PLFVSLIFATFASASCRKKLILKGHPTPIREQDTEYRTGRWFVSLAATPSFPTICPTWSNYRGFMAPLFCSRLRAIRTHFSRIGLSTGHQFSKIQLRWIDKFIFASLETMA